MVEKMHFGKEISISNVITVCSVIAGFIWYASQNEARLSNVERSVDMQMTLREDIAQIREQLKNLDRLTVRLETYLDRRTDLGKADHTTVITKDTIQ